MSLKHFHLIIILAGIVITAIFAGWCFFSPDAAGSSGYLFAGIGSALASLGLVIYEFYFLKKTRRLILN